MKLLFLLVVSMLASLAGAQTTSKVVDIATRSGVTQRMLVLTPPQPRAAVVLFAGGHGGLNLFANGSMGWGDNNFLVRSRGLFADQGFMVAVVDAPSDRQRHPYLAGFRQTPSHAADIRAVIAWLRASAKVPVWLVGTSRGTQSAGYLATELTGPDGPDGVVLTASILKDPEGRAVPLMPLEKIRIPVLVVHHEQDGCSYCPYAEIPTLMDRLKGPARSELISFTGGQNRGDPCAALAYHGFNGIEPEVIGKIAAWMTRP